MARKFLTPLDMGKNQIITPVVENLSGAPGSPVKGQLYMNTTDNILYWWNGSGWVAAQGGAGAVPATTVTTQAVGDGGTVGVATTFAREDHKHGMPSFGVITSVTTFGAAKSDGVAANIARSDHTHGSPTHDNAAHSAISHSALAAPTADVPWGGFKLTSLGAPTTGTDATTKTYVDNAIAGLAWKDSVRIAVTTNVTQSGLTAIDGVTPSANDRILCMGETSNVNNGIWLAQAGAWTRALDADAVGELEGAAAFVTEGTANGDKAFVCTTNGTITPGTTGNDWAQFGGGAAYVGGAGITQTGTTFDVVATNGSVVVAADTIGVGYAGSGTTFGTAVTAARSDHNHDTATGYTKMFAQDCAAATTTTVTHNFNSRDVVVNVVAAATPWDEVDVDIKRTTVNTVDVTFAVAPTAGAYRIVVVGIDL